MARIELTDEELAKFQKELGSVLEYFQILQEVDVANVEPMIHSVALENRKRKDEAHPKGVNEGRHLIDMAPDKKNGYLKVKSIL